MKIWLAILLAAFAAGCADVRESNNEQVVARGEGKDQWWDALPRASWGRFMKVPQSQPWFEVFAVADDVYAIYEPGQFEEVISYLIVGSTRAVLFDTGLGIGDMRRLASELTDREVLVLNSHSHYDHIAGNHQFEYLLGRDTAFTLGRAKGIAHEHVREFVGDGWIWKDTPTGFSASEYHVPPYSIDQFISDGERIFLGDRVLEIIFTPGHSPDSICLLDRDNRILFTGDTFYPAPLYTHLDGSDFSQYRASARLLAKLSVDVDTIMPAHNETSLSPDFLTSMHDAFEKIAAGKTTYTLSDGHREYAFNGFSIITN